jgi:hypothetical protein
MGRAAEVAARALPVAQSVGARDVEAEVTITLGAAKSYLGSAESGRAPLRSGVDLARELDLPVTALRGYINLSDVLELVGKHAEAALVAAEGLRLGRWAEVDRLTGEALRALPEGVFGATLRQLRAELALMGGQYDAAASELRHTRHAVGEVPDVQFLMPMRFAEGMIALARGDLSAARTAVTAGLADGMPSWTSRYVWPLLWLGMRVEADEATRARDRRELPPASLRQRCDLLAGLADGLVTPAPPSRGYQALVAAEHARAAGAGEAEAWSAAVAAWQETDEPYPLAYALVRLAEVHCAAGDWQAAGRAAAGPPGEADERRGSG